MINNCMFIGRLGRDPESRFTQSGKTVVNFSIACSEKRGGEEYTEWVNIVAWDKLGEICAQYLQKGSMVYISGRMQTRKWQDQSGTDRYTTEIVAREMKMLDSKKDGQQQNQQWQPQPQRMVPEADVPC
jgi:single-strand DNA-binding protein